MSDIQRQARWLVTDMTKYRDVRDRLRMLSGSGEVILKDWFLKKDEDNPQNYVRIRQISDRFGAFEKAVVTSKVMRGPGERDTGHMYVSDDSRSFFKLLHEPNTIKRRFWFNSSK